jgi:hypothetical protein
MVGQGLDIRADRQNLDRRYTPVSTFIGRSINTFEYIFAVSSFGH